MTIHLREIQIKQPQKRRAEHYPMSVPVVSMLPKVTFGTEVTILVGENGSGKSTLMEALARKAEMITIGSDEVHQDNTLAPIQPLVEHMRLVWNKRTHRGFFLRAEDFFGYVKRLRAMTQELVDDLRRVEEEYQGRSDYAKALASGPAASSLNAFNTRYGGDLDFHSHGESFLTLFQSRFVPGGLFILDEPEAALSPISQLGLISLIKEMSQRDGQFIIATHSPILMAFPGASILDLDREPPSFVQYNDLENVKLYRSFLDDPDAYLGRL
ncbi:MAG: AAA family ATPase [Anaerolineaceae bacterium]|nr:AAA family ATPase [Anaerolineaceae bacterium]